MMVAGLEFTGDNAVALFAQRFTRTGAGVVKLTRLTDNNRARAQNQDTFMSVRFGIAFFSEEPVYGRRERW